MAVCVDSAVRGRRTRPPADLHTGRRARPPPRAGRARLPEAQRPPGPVVESAGRLERSAASRALSNSRVISGRGRSLDSLHATPLSISQ
ncbi:hypothetical protein EVAR_45641_1 [Eumeta japonica]|uniref:Uncharacterized protein n=1 Tax=Eumeta variegata TaxID=151549 RepID=A0A4C1Y623_EUMVA|nr:hypothetical protein EVAR_45641_1 [Eumeta japonica]